MDHRGHGGFTESEPESLCSPVPSVVSAIYGTLTWSWFSVGT